MSKVLHVKNGYWAEKDGDNIELEILEDGETVNSMTVPESFVLDVAERIEKSDEEIRMEEMPSP